MLLKIAKSSVILGLAFSSLSASAFNEQAEKDRKAVIQYFETKFEDAEKNRDKFFPYSTDDEIKNVFEKGVKHQSFGIGSYSYNKRSKAQYLTFKDGIMPYEESIEKGEKLYNKAFANGKSLATCFPDPVVGHLYPKFDVEKKEVVSITNAINNCVRANGEKEWNTKDGDMAKVEAFYFMAYMSNGMKIDGPDLRK
ncbi:MAG: hypothetical protein HY307_02860 [Arcobacter sp.]|nr:hypothetical protein [Arcobacter sp.]